MCVVWEQTVLQVAVVICDEVGKMEGINSNVFGEGG